MATEGPAGLCLHHHHLDRPLATGHADQDAAGMAMEHEVQPRVRNSQSLDRDLIDRGGERGLADHETMGHRIDLEAEASAEELEHAPGGPGLRRAGQRVARRALVLPAGKSTEELRHSM